MTPKRIEELVYQVCGDNSLCKRNVRKALRQAVKETLQRASDTCIKTCSPDMAGCDASKKILRLK